jgi:hypothetical protein
MVQRNNRHIWVGLGFVLAAIAIAGAAYVAIKLGSPGQEPTVKPIATELAPSKEQPEHDPAVEVEQLLEPHLEGNVNDKSAEGPSVNGGTPDGSSAGSTQADSEIATERAYAQPEGPEKNAENSK